MYSMALTRGQPELHALNPSGRSLAASLTRLTEYANSPSLRFRLAIASNACAEIAPDNIAFVSTTSIALSSGGRIAMQTKSRSRTITNTPSSPPKRLIARRLPTKRPTTHPGEMLLEEFLLPLGISQSAFAVRLGISFPRLNEIIRRKRSVTPDTALRLARVLGVSADFWLGLQQDWDLWHAEHSENAAAIAELKQLSQAS